MRIEREIDHFIFPAVGFQVLDMMELICLSLIILLMMNNA